MNATTLPHTTDSVVSADGTTYGYRQLGHGPGVVLVHGGMGAAQTLMKLGLALAESFTVYIPDRRGRGLSGSYGNNYSVQRDVEDVDALLRKTGAQYIFGLSSGAIICLQAALKLPAIRKVVLYEPPLSIDHSTPIDWLTRYDREVAEGKLADAFVTVMKGISVDPFISAVPRFILVPFLKMGMNNEKDLEPNDVSLKALIPTQHYDGQLVLETEGTLPIFKDVQADVLLLGGSKSPQFLKFSLENLERVLPHVQRIELAGFDHVAPTDDGKPEEVAQELRKFFGA